MIQNALDAGPARDRVPLHCNRATVGRFEVRCGDHLLGATGGPDPPPCQEEESVAVLGRQVEIVGHEDRGRLALLAAA
jgi:hypothetical protein